MDTTGETLKSTTVDSGAGGTFLVGTDLITIAANQSLEDVAPLLNDVLAQQSPPGSAEWSARLNEIQIDTGGHEIITDPDDFLGLESANNYIDGRLDGKEIIVSEATGGVLQIGPDNQATNRIFLNIGDMRATGGELNLSGLSVANLESAHGVIERIDEAILVVSRQRGSLGATQNRLNYVTASLENAIENLTAAESSIRDADVAEEMAQFTRSQILTQASTAMLAQANALPQSALQLLQ